MTTEEYDPEEELASDCSCYSCCEAIKYGEDCVRLSLVYPAPYYGRPVLLDALEENGTYTAEPLLFCYMCWDVYVEDLRYELGRMFIAKKKASEPSPKRCRYCHTAINWGDYCVRIITGSLDFPSDSTATIFVPNDDEEEGEEDILCMDCLEWMNDDLQAEVWQHLWWRGGADVPEHPQRVPR